MHALHHIKFNNLTNFADITQFCSTRTGGLSTNQYKGLNLGYTVGDDTKIVTANRNLLAQSTDIDLKQLVFPKQTHSDNIGIVESLGELFPDTDALITNKKGICICVQTADCVPILIYDPKNKAIAAIHSGWQGTVNRISKKTIEKMQELYNSNPEDLIIGIGPSISPEVYEIGEDVISQVKQAFPNASGVLKNINTEGKALFNLWEAIKLTLIDTGIKSENIETAGICTFSNPEIFYSARRDGRKTGRMANGIVLK